MMIVLYDDILTQIILYLDDESCVVFARVCWRLHDLVHSIRKTVLITANIFEAVRCGSLLSFKYAQATGSDLMIAVDMLNISVDMLKSVYDRSDMVKYDNSQRNYIAYKLCKLGMFMRVNGDNLRRSLIIHAITHNKHELLAYIGSLGDATYQHAYSCGYAKIGDYDNFMKYFTQLNENQCDILLAEYAVVGGNHDIVQIVLARYCDGEDILEPKAIKAIKNDDYITFRISHIHEDLFIKYVVRYNALNIVRKIAMFIDIQHHAYYSYMTDHAIGMTLEMARLLLEVTNNDSHVVKLIVSAYDYRLTEMLRARGLYSKKLTMKSNHREFV